MKRSDRRMLGYLLIAVAGLVGLGAARSRRGGIALAVLGGALLVWFALSRW